MSTMQDMTLTGAEIFGTSVFTSRDIRECGDYLEDFFEDLFERGDRDSVLGFRVIREDHALTVGLCLGPEILQHSTMETYVNALIDGFISMRDEESEENEEEENEE